MAVGRSRGGESGGACVDVGGSGRDGVEKSRRRPELTQFGWRVLLPTGGASRITEAPPPFHKDITNNTQSLLHLSMLHKSLQSC